MVNAFIVFCEKKKVFGLLPFLACSSARIRSPRRQGLVCGEPAVFVFGSQATRLPLKDELRSTAPHWRKKSSAAAEIEPNCLTLA
jgi:hypothetical protein